MPSRLPLLLVIATLICCSGCTKKDPAPTAVSGSNPTPRKVLRFGNGSEPQDIDPAIVTGTPEYRLLQTFSEGLVSEDPDMQIIPGAAERWDASGAKPLYANKRAEIWGNLRDWLADGCLPPDPELRADLVGIEYGFNAKGEITVKTDKVRQVLEYAQRLVKVLPADAVSYDDATNNRALISGKSALIWNPPSAWAVARRDAPKVAEDCWTFPAPKGPAGRFMPMGAFSWGVWKFAQNKSAAKALIEFLSQRENVEARCNASLGYDVPPFISMSDFKVWEEVGPPKGTVYHYPVRKSHNEKTHIALSPAPPSIAVQIYNRGTLPTMFAKLQSGQTIPQVMDWAQDEIEGFTR